MDTSRIAWAAFIAAATLGQPVLAQDINLGSGGATLIWNGETPSARAGASLDQGAVNASDTRRDLIVGAPGNGVIAGRVDILLTMVQPGPAR